MLEIEAKYFKNWVLLAVVAGMAPFLAKPALAFSGNTAPAPGPSPAPRVEKTDLKMGRGQVVVAGKKLVVHYNGFSRDGRAYDSSRERGTPMEFTVGDGAVLPGWDAGVRGMKVGGIRKLVIPPELAYGARGHGNEVPPNTTLVFEIEILEIK